MGQQMERNPIPATQAETDEMVQLARGQMMTAEPDQSVPVSGKLTIPISPDFEEIGGS
jgi:hypothetical protein